MLAHRLKVAVYITFQSLSAILYTLVSKWTLNVFKGPITLLAVQSSLSVLLLVTFDRLLGTSVVQVRAPWKAWSATMPLTLARFFGVLSKTYCLANVDASFYQNARGLLLPFTAVLAFFAVEGTNYSTHVTLSIAVIICGFAIGVRGDTQADLTSTLGLSLGIGSSFATAVETVVVRRYADRAKNNGDMLQTLFMANAMSLLLYLPLCNLSGELAQLSHLQQGRLTAFTVSGTLAGVVGFILASATWLQIKITSPVTHTVVAACRGVIQSLTAAAVLQEPFTATRWVSTLLILGGSALFTWLKIGEESAQDVREASPSSTVIVDHGKRAPALFTGQVSA